MAHEGLSHLEHLEASVADLSTLSEKDRLRMLRLCGKITSTIERPFETMCRHMWSACGPQLAIHLGLEWKLFHVVGKVGDAPVSSATIAAGCLHRPDPIMVVRVLRVLASVDILCEVESELYSATSFSEALQTEPFELATRYLFEDLPRATSQVRDWLADNGWKNPDNIADTAFTRAFEVPTMYEHFGRNEKFSRRFGGFMATFAAGRPSFWDPDFYPVQDRLGSAKSPEDVLLVDIGGGDGGDLKRFRNAFPELEGRLVLQDLGPVVKRAADPAYEAMEYDWMQSQPIKGARAYMFHHILHDFGSDDAVRALLKNVTDVMEPGYSKLLIKDGMLPNKGAPFTLAGMDLGIMYCLAGRERTEAEWQSLLASAGLRVEAIFTHDRSDDGVIECVLA